jgi:hypothetical protein
MTKEGGKGVAKVGRDTAVNAMATPEVNGAFHRLGKHGGSRKVGTNGKVGVENTTVTATTRQQSTKSDDGKRWH